MPGGKGVFSRETPNHRGGREDDERGKVVIERDGTPRCIRSMKLATAASVWGHRLGAAAYLLDIDVSDSLWQNWQHTKPDYRDGQLHPRPPTAPESVLHVTAAHFEHCLNRAECTRLQTTEPDRLTYWWRTKPCFWIDQYLEPHKRHRHVPVGQPPSQPDDRHRPVAPAGRAANRAATPGRRSVSPRYAREEKKLDELAMCELFYRVKRTTENANEE